jgi:hypothetical protein
MQLKKGDIVFVKRGEASIEAMVGTVYTRKPHERWQVHL